MAENPKLLSLLYEIAADQNLLNYEIKVTPVSSGGANYTSHLYSIIISSEDNILHLFAKVAAFGKKMRGDISINIFGTEAFICTELKDAFKHIEDQHHLEKKYRIQMPKVYGSNIKSMEEMVVFEDLSSKGFTTYNRLKSVTWKYAAAACTELAKLHALSMAYEHYHPDKFKKTLEFLAFDMIDVNPSGMKIFWEGSKQTALGVVREDNRERLKKFLEGMSLEVFGTQYYAIKRQVLMHGDFRVSNIMHRDREDGSVEIIPLDYQTMRGGCLVVDLYYFIFTGTDSKFRDKYYDKLILHYYTELCAALTRLGLSPNDVYSKDDFEFELKEKLPFGLTVAVFMLPIITVEAENAPQVNAEMEMTDFNVKKTGDHFPGRLNGVVDDFVKWGVL